MKKKQRWNPPAAPGGARAPSGLVGRLLDVLQRRQRSREDLAPPGHRSGEGSESLAPYLEQGRSTRPSPLE